MTASVPNELLGIEEGKRTPPKSRLPDGCAGRTLVKKVVSDDKPRSDGRALVQGMVAGNQPYNPAQLRKEGRSWEANINWMGGQALMEGSGIPYYSIFTGTEYFADCKTAYQPENPNHEQWNRRITCRFHEMLKRWPGFDREIKQASYWMRMHGIGPVIWPDVSDWRFRSIRTGNVLVEKGTPSCLDKRHRFIVVRDSFTAVELWGFIKDVKDEDVDKNEGHTDAGWNVKTARLALMKAAKGIAESAGWGTDSWERYQTEFKNNDLGVGVECDTINVAHIYVTEFDGKVSHMIVTEDELEAYANPTEGQESKDKGFLFRAIGRYDSYAEAIVAFFLDSGDGTWHSVRGLADKAFRHLAAENNLKNTIYNGVTIRSKVILQAKDAASKKGAMLTNIGTIAVLDPGIELKQLQMGVDIEAAITADRMFGNQMAQNLGVFQQRTMSRDDGRGEQPTATAVNQQVLKESSLSAAQITEFYFPLDQVTWETFRRAVESSDPEAKRFVKECIADGVPKEALKKMEYVRFNRTAGYGSPQMRLLQHEQMFKIASRLPEQGLQNLTDDFIGATAGSDKIDRYNPKTSVPTMDDAMAGMENNAMRDGQSPMHYSGEGHQSHLEIHLADAEAYLAPIQEAVEMGEGDPAILEEAFNYVTVLAEHCQGHLSALSGDPARKEMADMLSDKLDVLASFSGKIRSAIIRAQRQAELAAQEAQQATAMGELDQAKVRSMETADQLRARKTENDIALKRAKAMEEMRLKRFRTVGEFSLKKQQTEESEQIAA